MRRIQSYLKDVEAKQMKTQVESNFIREIWDLAYDVENIIDTYFPKIRSSRTRWEGFLGCSNMRIARGFAKEVEGIKKSVEDITNARKTFEIDKSSCSREEDTWDPRRTFPHVDEPNVVGFDDLIENLVQNVLGEALSHRVVSIIGMAGLGKTTLARKVYNFAWQPKAYDSVQQRFDCAAWICVSECPNLKKLLRDIAAQVGLKKEKMKKNFETNLFKFLSGNRYVIVIDDIWHTTAWDALKICLPMNSENGSRIILTSRNRDVGIHVGGVNSVLELQPLDPETSRILFNKMILHDPQDVSETRISPQLDNIGKQILERCDGVPLAIVLAAGLLKIRGRSETAWKGVLESMGQVKDQCAKIFALSYKDLPLSLKPCFLYFGLFPEDYEIEVFELINLWAAEGFIKGSRVREVEEVGDDYINCLIARNLIQVVRRRFDGRVRSCRIHDILHSICIQEANDINFFNIHTDTINCNTALKVHRAAIHGSDIGHYLFLNSRTSSLRAMLSFYAKGRWRDMMMKNLIRNSKFLRVFRFEDYRISKSLSTEICNLRQLTYLKLGSPIVELPYALTNLVSLLTLDVGEARTVFLPNVVWSMKQLRHILLPEDCFAPSFGRINLDEFHPVEFSLPNLQTLYGLPSLLFKADWLLKLTNLRTLRVNMVTEDIVKVFRLLISSKLEELCLCTPWFAVCRESLDFSGYMNLCELHMNSVTMNELPRHDWLPPNLTRLTLIWTSLRKDPMETLKKLQKLRNLKLGTESYMGKELVCSGEPGNFPQLEVLEIKELHFLKMVVIEEGGMPRLKDLRILKCNPVKQIPKRMRSIMRTK